MHLGDTCVANSRLAARLATCRFLTMYRLSPLDGAPTRLYRGLVRRHPSCADCRILGVGPSHGADHTGHLDMSVRWFYTDAGLLIKYSREAYPLHTPTMPLSRQDVLAKRTASCYFNNTHHRRSRPTRRDGEGGRGRSTGHAYSGACTDEDTGSAAAHTHLHHHHACRT
jgi:hypothetical protein